METMKTTISECINDNQPWYCGVCSVSNEDLQLYFRGKYRSHVIDIPKATITELDDLCATCDISAFTEDRIVHNEPLTLEKTRFAMNLSPSRLGISRYIRPTFARGDMECRNMVFQLQNLRVYGQNSFLGNQSDNVIQRVPNAIGFLVVVLPTKHYGGCLFLQHSDNELEFDAARILKGQDKISVAFVAFLGDVDLEVQRVTAGRRVTLTYSIHYSPVLTFTTRVGSKGPILQRCTEALRTHLRDPLVFPNGGYLGFGLQHRYPMDEREELEELHVNLKGIDALLYEACEEAGLDVFLRVIYHLDQYQYMTEEPFKVKVEVEDLDLVMQTRMRSIAFSIGQNHKEDGDPLVLPDFLWVKQCTRITTHQAHYVQRDNGPQLHFLNGWVNMIAYVPPLSKRKRFPAPRNYSKKVLKLFSDRREIERAYLLANGIPCSDHLVVEVIRVGSTTWLGCLFSTDIGEVQ